MKKQSRTHRILAVLALGVVSLQAQNVAPGIGIWPVPDANQLQKVLLLSDAQMEQLRRIRQEKNEASQRMTDSLLKDQSDLQRLLEAQSGDLAGIATLALRIHKNQRELQRPGDDRYRQQALAILGVEQKKTLATLETALKLQPAAGEAVGFNLLDYPDGRGDIQPAASQTLPN